MLPWSNEEKMQRSRLRKISQHEERHQFALAGKGRKKRAMAKEIAGLTVYLRSIDVCLSRDLRSGPERLSCALLPTSLTLPSFEQRNKTGASLVFLVSRFGASR